MLIPFRFVLCLSLAPTGYPNSAISEEFHLKNHWKILLAGARGAGMFNHSDTLLTSSWHAHLTGRKWWYVCGHDADGNQVCYEDYLMPGEVLYYGPHWHHETQNIVTPSITITDTVRGLPTCRPRRGFAAACLLASSAAEREGGLPRRSGGQLCPRTKVAPLASGLPVRAAYAWAPDGRLLSVLPLVPHPFPPPPDPPPPQVAFEGNYQPLAEKLYASCSHNDGNMLFSAQLCDALMKCFANWERDWGDHEDEDEAARQVHATLAAPSRLPAPAPACVTFRRRFSPLVWRGFVSSVLSPRTCAPALLHYAGARPACGGTQGRGEPVPGLAHRRFQNGHPREGVHAAGRQQLRRPQLHYRVSVEGLFVVLPSDMKYNKQKKKRRAERVGKTAGIRRAWISHRHASQACLRACTFSV